VPRVYDQTSQFARRTSLTNGDVWSRVPRGLDGPSTVVCKRRHTYRLFYSPHGCYDLEFLALLVVTARHQRSWRRLTQSYSRMDHDLHRLVIN
jgi:hypothetical protein